MRGKKIKSTMIQSLGSTTAFVALGLFAPTTDANL